MGLNMITIMPNTTDTPTLKLSGDGSIPVLQPHGGGTHDFTQLQWPTLREFDAWLAKVVEARAALVIPEAE